MFQRRVPCLLMFLLALTQASTASAQNRGFQLNRYEPTPAGSWTFAVDNPWYSKTRDFAAGLTLNYAHDPLVFGLRGPNGDFSEQQVVVEHQLLFHFDLAVALFDRLNLSLSLPVTVYEAGQAVAGVAPLSGGAAGDPRLGAFVRLYKDPQRDPFSLSLGAYLWIPTSSSDNHSGDIGVRVLPQLVASGVYRWLRWSALAGIYYRPEAVLGALADQRGSTVGTAFQLGAHVAYTNLEKRFSVGPELLMDTTVVSGHAFQKDYTNVALLLGGSYNILSQVQAGLALGLGTLRDPGSPDFRLLFRIAYAPILKRQPAPPVEHPPCPACNSCCAPPPPPPPVVKCPEPEIPEEQKEECDNLSDQDTFHFADGSYELDRQSDKAVDELAGRVAALSERARTKSKSGELRDLEIQIVGHTSHTGPGNEAGLRNMIAGRNPTAAGAARWAQFQEWRAAVPQAKADEWVDEYSKLWPPLIKGNLTRENMTAIVLGNMWLSEKRAETIKSLLQERLSGKVPGQWVSQGKAMLKPEIARTDRDAQTANRRVQIIIKHRDCKVVYSKGGKGVKGAKQVK